jgi:hypothetical protein
VSGHTPWSEIRKTKAELHAALAAAEARAEKAEGENARLHAYMTERWGESPDPLPAALAHVEALKEAGEGLAGYISTVVREFAIDPSDEPPCLAAWREAVSASAAK